MSAMAEEKSPISVQKYWDNESNPMAKEEEKNNPFSPSSSPSPWRKPSDEELAKLREEYKEEKKKEEKKRRENAVKEGNFKRRVQKNAAKKIERWKTGDHVFVKVDKSAADEAKASAQKSMKE